nr:threonine--tRNA ligase [Actinomycetota bacterium]
MSTQIKVKINGVAQEVDAEKKPTHLFAEDSNVVVCKINGELRDLWTDLSNGDEIESVSIDSADGLNVLRHSTAHVLAQAVQEVFPETKLGIGPPIRDGFYYDFDPKEAFT